ncbi:MAG: nucleotidyltransferase domain-containing protein [Dissulfuribacterales bacterium]
MAITTDGAIRKAQDFLAALTRDGIDISEAYVFGSTIHGSQNEDSDIDVAVISKNFSGFRYYDIKRISRLRRAVDLRLEIHPFAYDDICSSPPQFYLEIKKTGRRIR